MIYYFCESKGKGNHAGVKAPSDIIQLCNDRGYIPIEYPRSPTGKTKILVKVKKIVCCLSGWSNAIRTAHKGDVVIYQHPTYGNYLSEKLIKIAKARGIQFIAIIHDLESLRDGVSGLFEANSNKYQYADTKFLSHFDRIICHNTKMKDYLLSKGFDEDRVVCLEIFDYLTNESVPRSDSNTHGAIIVAGNLAPGKSGYLYKLENTHVFTDQIVFNLYGINYHPNKDSSFMKYFGTFDPSELPGKLSGDFGLVWDGNEVDTCSGNTGNYLRYNNPHKASLYLASGIPLIVWEQSALADFVKKYRVGIGIDNLLHLPEVISSISDAEYAELKNNALEMSGKVRSGHFFYAALDKALNGLIQEVV